MQKGWAEVLLRSRSHDEEIGALHRAWQSVASFSHYHSGGLTRNDLDRSGGAFGRVVSQMKVAPNSAAKCVEADRLTFGSANSV